MIGKSWRILRGKVFPPENANFWTWVYKQLHWTSNRLVFVNAAGTERKAAWLRYAINIVCVECGYLALYTNWVFVSVELCWLYTKLGQLDKSLAGASVNFFLKQREYRATVSLVSRVPLTCKTLGVDCSSCREDTTIALIYSCCLWSQVEGLARRLLIDGRSLPLLTVIVKPLLGQLLALS